MSNVCASQYIRAKLKGLIFFIISFLCIVSCDKVEIGNPFRGQWQIIEWTDATGLVVATNEAQMYYSFQLGVISLCYFATN